MSRAECGTFEQKTETETSLRRRPMLSVSCIVRNVVMSYGIV
jgi:hypothetical protein